MPTHLVPTSPRTVPTLVLALACALAVAGCYREVTGDPQPARDRREHPFTIAGVRPGQTAQEVTQRWGEPSWRSPGSGSRVWRWTEREEVTVTLDPHDRVIEVFGPSLAANGRVVVGSGASEAEVVQILGRGKVQEARRPSGFVIAVGSKVVGRILTYHDRDARIEITLTEDSVRHVRLYAEPEAVARR